MKKFYQNVSLMLLVFFLTYSLTVAQITTPAPSPKSTMSQMVGLTEIEVEYSRPGVKDRLIFGEASEGALVPYGQIWRTGANAATTISFSEDVTFGGKEVNAGKYALYTIPGEDEWTIMLYEDLTLGGAVANYDESKEVVRFSVPSKELDHKHESFLITVDNIKNKLATV
jgi:hypothetical protein